jgi:FlgD Ig-like domain
MNKNLVPLIICISLLIAQTASAQWIQTNSPGGHITAIAVSDSNIFVGTGNGIFRSANNGKDWTAIDSGLTNTDVFSLEVSDTNIFAGTGNGVFRSTNNGASWTAVNSGITNTSSVNAFAVSGDTIFAGTVNGIFRSTNSGTSWTVVDSGLRNTKVLSFAVSDSAIFAGTDNGVFQSTNNGGLWTTVDSGLINTSVMSLAVSGSEIWAGTKKGVFMSYNTSWGLINNSINSFAVPFGDYLFAGTSTGVFQCNFHTMWHSENTDLLNANVTFLAVKAFNLFAVTAEGNIWHRPLSEMIEVSNRNPSNQKISPVNLKIFSQSRLNPNIAIQFSLSHSDQVAVKIYNLSGREIATLANKNLGAGEHSLSWDTKNVAAGCYAVKMQVGSNVFVKNISVSR